MFSDESRFSLQSDSRQTAISRAPGTRYHQENSIERHRYGHAGWLVRGGIILGYRTDLHVQSVHSYFLNSLAPVSLGFIYYGRKCLHKEKLTKVLHTISGHSKKK
ncbi:transposable element Tcb1 transposase [Trichonephila clavipes]|nr:transposable element Tcb1 transposase [Trichonephila clavipes]